MAEGDRYVPAAGRGGLTRLYDPAMRVTMREKAWRPRLQEQVLEGLGPGARVVDVGAGTGTSAIALAQARGDITVVGVDGDREALAIAARKPGAERVGWREGLATDLPLEDRSADRVVMSLLLHHLSTDDKRRALAEAARVLRPGGRVHIADWGRAPDPFTRIAFFALRLLDGLGNTRDHAKGRLPVIVRRAGLVDTEEHLRVRTPLGSLELLSAHRR